MTKLGYALEDYYSRRDGKLTFINGMSLNQLAIKMWEALGFCQIDASVLSKVINGKRLFTPLQLNVFCKLLNISFKEEAHLQYCLNKDYCERYNIDLDTHFISKESALDLLNICIKEVLTAESKSPIHLTNRLPQIIEQFTKGITDSSLDITYEKTVFEILGASLYFKAKRLINFKHGSLYIAENNALSRIYASSPILYNVFPRKTGTTMSVYREKQPSSYAAEYIVSIHPELSNLEIGSDLVIPLTYGNRTFGVLSMLSYEDYRFTPKDILTLQNHL